MARSVAEVLRRTEETLATARLGLQDVLGADPARRLGGLRNLIVFGRAVTNVLQGLRSLEHSFEAWYAPYVAEMRADPLLKYVYILRSEILKEGALKTSSRFTLHHFEYPRDMHRLGPAPPGARGFFLGDQAGGSGWEIELPDGAVEKLYVDLPAGIAESEIHLPDAPLVHRGAPVADRRIETISSLYFDYLAALVADARREFLRRPTT